MVDQPVDNGANTGGIGQHLAPFTESPAPGDDRRFRFLLLPLQAHVPLDNALLGLAGVFTYNPPSFL